MIYTHIAAALIGAAVAAVSAWQVQNWRYGEQMAEIRHDQAVASKEAEKFARQAETQRRSDVDEAIRNSTVRAIAARRDADAARSELDRMRDTINASRGGVPGESPGACAVRADAAGELLAQCAGAYQWLAEVADRLNADRLMLIEAWPK
jgi:hypothetical protein